MKIRTITDGNRVYLAPKNIRMGSGNFEAGPRDKDGVKHTQGIFHVAYENFRSREEAEICTSYFPKEWL